MSILGFSPEFRDQVEDGRKCRTYRMPKCIYETKTGRCTHIGIGSICSHDYLNCPGYEYRIKPGSTIHAYTGLMQRKYCTNAGSTFFKVNMDDRPPQKCDVIYQHCWKSCHYRGAKLLRPDLPKCIDTYPIKMKYITEEDARLDGFEWHEKDVCKRCNDSCLGVKHTQREGNPQTICAHASDISNTPLGQLRAFLIKNHNAKPDTPIQAIIWEEIKGRNAGK